MVRVNGNAFVFYSTLLNDLQAHQIVVVTTTIM